MTKQTLLEKIEEIYEEVFNSSDFNERQPEYELLIKIKKIIKEEVFDDYEKRVDMEERKQNHIKKSAEETKTCEKCGGELKTTIVGDESYDKCVDCGWITH